MDHSIYIGADIGGSHITVSAIDGNTLQSFGNLYRQDMHASIRAADFVARLGGLIQSCMQDLGEQRVAAVCLAVPGPFDYDHGIAWFDGSNQKMTNLFALNIPASLCAYLHQPDLPIICCNDALAFALGEYHVRNNARSTTLAITLGSGLGSAFIQDHQPYQDASGFIPRNGELYHWPYQLGVAEDYFSSAALVARYCQATGIKTNGVKQISDLAAQDDEAAIHLFENFGIELAQFLNHWIQCTAVDTIVIGGSISGAWKYFYPSLQKEIDRSGFPCSIHRSESPERSATLGSVIHGINQIRDRQPVQIKRVTTEKLMPGRGEPEHEPSEGYRIYPTAKLADACIHDDLTELLLSITETGYLRIDGYQGVDWEAFIQQANRFLSKKGIACSWYSIEAAFASNIAARVADSLGEEDSIFGKICRLSLSSLFSEDKLALITSGLDGFSIIYGIGALCLDIDSPTVYIDMPKNELQFRMRAGGIRHLGKDLFAVKSVASAYKHCYFVDWPILNRHKSDTIRNWDYVIDGQQEDRFHWMQGVAYRRGLESIAQQPFRARPWFEPGVWGGKWMQSHIRGLNKEAVNYAWSFELITPENGLVMEANHLRFETSFDCIMYLQGADVLGVDYDVFHHHFPIRFDFLDTIQGGNLSIQCHPSPTYMKETFGEPFTQDETYYILDHEQGAKVYLGFQEDIQPEQFKQVLQTSSLHGTAVDIAQYVQSFDSSKHALYLIPHCTIHGSGSGNLVLEISSTPYIFTFKLYDWLRMGLDGKPRPLNIDHGFHNLDFSRKGNRVAAECMAVPRLIENGDDWACYELPTHDLHFYRVQRFHFKTKIRISKVGKCHVAMLVAGDSISIHTEHHEPQEYHYAETFIVPGAVDSYEVMNRRGDYAMLLIAFVKDGLPTLL
jgi:predicted NBD/HSP70 family sugar kinase